MCDIIPITPETVIFEDQNHPIDLEIHVFDTIFKLNRSVVGGCSPQLLEFFLTGKDGQSLALPGETLVLQAAIEVFDTHDKQDFVMSLRTHDSNHIFRSKSIQLSQNGEDSLNAESMESKQDIRQHFHNILLACYRKRLTKFHHVNDFNAAVEIAYGFDFLPSIEANILAATINSDVQKKIWKSPFYALVAAYRIRSERLYKEAFVHSVGTFPTNDWARQKNVRAIMGILSTQAIDKFESEIVRVSSELSLVLKMVISYHTTRSNYYHNGSKAYIPDNYDFGSHRPLHKMGNEAEYVRWLKTECSLKGPLADKALALLQNHSIDPAGTYPHLTCAVIEDDEMPW